MNLKAFAVLLWVAAIFVGGPLGAQARGEEAAHLTQPLEIVTAAGWRKLFNVEIAVTPEEQTRGLMQRSAIPENGGMLFIFEREAIRSFWMKDTLIPLDILYIDLDGNVVKIYENARPGDETPLSSGVPVFAALEIRGGTAARQGVAPGAVVHHDAFGNFSKE